MIEFDFQRNQGDFDLDVKCRLNAPVVGLFGASGAGKSTLLGMIAGLVKPHSGQLILDGECLFDSQHAIDVPIHQRRIGVVFQDSRLFPHLNIRDNLNYGFLTLKDKRFSFKQIVDLLEIGHLLSQKPHQISGGEKQRVSLGRALLTSPRLLLLDEPLAALDVRLKHQILPFLRRVKDEINIPMIYVSHAIDEILYVTSEIVIIEQGKLLAQGRFHEIIHQDNLQRIAQSLGLENVIGAVIASHDNRYGSTTLKHGSQTIVAPIITADTGAQITISIPASSIALSISRLESVTIQNQLQGQVTEIKQIGYRVLVTVDIGESQIVAEVTTKALETLNIVVGNSVYCLIKAQAIRAHGFI
ncbi:MULTISPECIES: molybdenum ABC transporter ATP-binding protein [Methylotenera]|uniref:molybdenum ABC transporter ATP-binding protein n=1 Tax=Methylotenera TaxID=359407 RepID=UPI00038148AE|nr:MULTISPECIES: molybdenum ABC transporter ATP-binding protein [Methylotenera]